MVTLQVGNRQGTWQLLGRQMHVDGQYIAYYCGQVSDRNIMKKFSCSLDIDPAWCPQQNRIQKRLYHFRLLCSVHTLQLSSVNVYTVEPKISFVLQVQLQVGEWQYRVGSIVWSPAPAPFVFQCQPIQQHIRPSQPLSLVMCNNGFIQFSLFQS